jgi:hypothetical protein
MRLKLAFLPNLVIYLLYHILKFYYYFFLNNFIYRTPATYRIIIVLISDEESDL